MGANEDFKRLAKEMAEKARAQREKAERTAQTKRTEGDGTRETPDQARRDSRPKSDRK